MEQALKQINTELKAQLKETLQEAKSQLSEINASIAQLEQYSRALNEADSIIVTTTLLNLTAARQACAEVVAELETALEGK